MKFLLSEALAATGGALLRGEGAKTVFEGVSTDTRKELAGTLFVALPGERFDAHDFLDKAVSGGAAGLLVSKDTGVKGAAVIKVPDTLAALGSLGRMARRKAGYKLAAVTGSFGKTTTKELALRLLRGAGVKTLGTPGNLNNLIGLPLTLLGAAGDEKFAVVELGISVPAEMERLAKICEPDVALVTGVGPAHTEGLGDVAGVAREKLSIAEGLASGGTLILPHGDPAIEKAAEKLRKDIRIVTFGWEKGADFRGEGYESLGEKGSSFYAGGRKVFLPLPGRHNASNALAALALVANLGVSLPPGEELFGREGAASLRGEIAEGPNGSHLLVDCYNANPGAVKAALDTLADLAGGGKKVLVLGDMRELGTLSASEHSSIGVYAVEKGVGELFLLGPETAHTAEAAGKAGLPAAKIHMAGSIEALSEELPAVLGKGDWVLIKGSRAHKLDLLLSLLRKKRD